MSEKVVKKRNCGCKVLHFICYLIKASLPPIFVVCFAAHLAPGVVESFKADIFKKRIVVYENILELIYEQVLEPHEVSYGWALHKKVFHKCTLVYGFGSKDISNLCGKLNNVTHEIASALENNSCGDTKLKNCSKIGDSERKRLINKSRDAAREVIKAIAKEYGGLIPGNYGELN